MTQESAFLTSLSSSGTFHENATLKNMEWGFSLKCLCRAIVQRQYFFHFFWREYYYNIYLSNLRILEIIILNSFLHFFLEISSEQQNRLFFKNLEPWLVWLNGLGIILQTERSPVQFPGSYIPSSGHMPGLRVRSPVGGIQEATNCCFSSSLFLFLPISPKIIFLFCFV